MDFDLSDEQRLLKESVERLIADRYGFEQRRAYAKEPDGWSAELWAQYADLGLQLGAQSGYELSLKNENDLLQTLTSANDVVTTNLTTAQDALNSILSGAQSAAASLTSWTSTEVNAGATLQTLGAKGDVEKLPYLAATLANQPYNHDIGTRVPCHHA